MGAQKERLRVAVNDGEHKELHRSTTKHCDHPSNEYMEHLEVVGTMEKVKMLKQRATHVYIKVDPKVHELQEVKVAIETTTKTFPEGTTNTLPEGTAETLGHAEPKHTATEGSLGPTEGRPELPRRAGQSTPPRRAGQSRHGGPPKAHNHGGQPWAHGGQASAATEGRPGHTVMEGRLEPTESSLGPKYTATEGNRQDHIELHHGRGAA